MAAICHKYWGSRPEATSLPLSILLFPFPLMDSPGVWTDPAHPLPNMLMQFMQSNSLIKFTLMFNVLPGTEISVHAEFSNCRQKMPEIIVLWIKGHVLYSSNCSMAVKKWGPCTFGPPLPESGGQDPHRITATGKKRGAEVAQIEKLKASRGNGERVPPAGVWRSIVNSPSWAPAEDSFAAFRASKSTSVGNKCTHKLLRNYARKNCVFSAPNIPYVGTPLLS